MKERAAKDAIKKIAKREGKSESEIRRLPSPEEFISVLSREVAIR